MSRVKDLIKRVSICAVLFAAVLPIQTMAQGVPLSESSDSDLQARFRVALEIPLAQKLKLTWSEQLRTKESFSQLDKMLTSFTLDYQAWRHLGFEGEYVFVNERKGDELWKVKHRFNLAVIGKLSVGRFDLSLRERVRFVVRSYDTDKYLTADPFVTLRSRLKADYRNESRWKPYAYVELYTTLNAPGAVDNRLTCDVESDNYINRVRLCIGSTMKIDSHNSMDFYYMVHFNRTQGATYDAVSGNLTSRTLKKVCAHVIGIDYKFKL
ncbi:MAG: DUF2490 domain-containing protein [Alistipes sp.]|nr:DUF2490 domain-containing protein [Alistipes sp.]MBR7096840.1 DUF2490 domain-containing protein [Alistipes sp.]